MTSGVSEMTVRGATGPTASARAVGAGGAILAIWMAVVLTGLFAKDFVSGSQQQHIHLAALQNWFWGSIATGFVFIPIMARRREPMGSPAAWYALGGATAAIWTAVTVLSIFAPSYVTGSDPTRIPTAAILSPIIGMVGTGFVAVFTTVFTASES